MSPEEMDLAVLPSPAILAFAARCCRRLQPLLDLGGLASASDHRHAVDHAISLAEMVADGRLIGTTYSAPTAVANAIANSYGHIGGWEGALTDLDGDEVASQAAENAGRVACIASRIHEDRARKSEESRRRGEFKGTSLSAVFYYQSAQYDAREAALAKSAEACAQAAKQAALAAAAVVRQRRDNSARARQLVMTHAMGALASIGLVDPEHRSSLLHDVRDDWALLVASAQESPVVPSNLKDFYALHSTFDTGVSFGSGTIVQIVSGIQPRLASLCSKDPSLLLGLSAREFEQLIAELFEGFGFRVELTKRTRDGGKDIVAMKHDIVAVRYIIECKRYAPRNKVGIAVVQRLHGVVSQEGANKGILATTSSLTTPARQFVEKVPWLLEAKEYEGLIEWLRLYQKEEMARRMRSLP